MTKERATDTVGIIDERRRPASDFLIGLLALTGLLALPSILAAQTTAPNPRAVQPERPTVATHAGTVARGWLEIETGVEVDRFANGAHGGFAPTTFKIGLAPSAQLNITTPLVHSAASGVPRFGDLAAGVKWRLADNAPVLGRFAVLPAIKVPTGSTAYGAGTGTTDLGLLLISSHDLGAVAMDVNVGYLRRSGIGSTAPKDSTLWTVSFGGSAREWLGWTAELYGYPATAGPAGARQIVAVLVGPTVAARPWLVFDAGVIAPLTGPQPRAIYVGLVYNVGKLAR